jgi:hypothetical protein
MPAAFLLRQDCVRGTRSPDDPRAGGGPIEILLRGRNRFPTEKLRQQAQEQIEAARLVYGRIIRDAK